MNKLPPKSPKWGTLGKELNFVFGSPHIEELRDKYGSHRILCRGVEVWIVE